MAELNKRMTKKLIKQIITEAFRVSPSERAAFELYSKGVTVKDIVVLNGISDPMRNAVINSYRDIQKRLI